MRTAAVSRLLARRRTLLLALLVALAASTSAWAFWAGKSSGNAAGRVGSLAAAQIGSTTPGGGTVALSWTTVSAPGAGAVSYYVSRDGGAASSACPSSTAPSTQTSCTDTGVSTGSHKYTVTAVWHSWTAKSESASAQVASGAATHFVLTPATTMPTAGVGDNLTITAKDAANNTVTSYGGPRTLTFTGANAAGTTNPTVAAASGAATAFGTSESIDFSSGVASVSGQTNGVMTLYKAETANVKVSDGAIESNGVSVTVGPASASSFAVATPSTQTAGNPFSVALTALDAYGNTATGYTGKQTIAFGGPASSPNGKSPSYPAQVTFVAGVGAPSITLYDAQTTALSAKDSSASISGTSGSFTVGPASASSFAIPTPATQTAGTPFNVTLTAKDEYGNTATGYAGARTLAFSGPETSPAGDAPKFPTTVTFSSGIGTATGITLYDAGSPSLTAKEGAAVSGGSGSFTVNGLSATSKFLLSTPSPNAGSSFTETITATDTYGNTTSSFTGSHTLTFSGPASGPNGKSPTYPSSVSFNAGVGTPSITLYDVQTTTLTAKQTTPTALSGISASFTVAAGSAATFSVPTPSTQTVGNSFNETLTALDAGGNVATSYSGEKPVAFKGPQTSEGGETPKYPASMTFTAGAGTAAITLYDQTSGTTLEATQGAVKGVSGSFAVNTGAAARLAWSVYGFNFSGHEEGTCYFTCTWVEIGRGHTWKAEVQVTDVGGNVVSNIGSGHVVSFNATNGSLSSTTLTLPSSGPAHTGMETYTSSGSNSWSSDTLTAHATGYTDATVLFKK